MAWARRTHVRIARWRALRRAWPHLQPAPMIIEPEPMPPAPPPSGSPQGAWPSFRAWLQDKAAQGKAA